MNPFVPLYHVCNSGTPEQKNAGITDLPIIVDAEPVGLCNFRCVMCPTGLGMMGRPSGFMSDETHANMLKKFPRAGVRYIGWGEPTLHPDFLRFVERSKADRRIVHMNTNGSALDLAYMTALVGTGIDSIKVSFQGVDRESYLKMRKIDLFDELVDRLKALRGLKRYGNPWISASTTVTDEPEEQISRFVAEMSQIVDHLSVGRTTFDFIDREKIPEKRRSGFDEARKDHPVKHPVPCPEVWNKVTVHWDGAVRVCCNDFSGETYLGNVNHNTTGEIWFHPTMMEYRARLAKKQYEGRLCGTCDAYMS